MSLNPSKVRRAALNLLYALAESGEAFETFDRDLFWDMAQEKDTDHYRIALAKALLHTSRNSADSARLLVERSQRVEQAMQHDLTTAALREEIARYARRSADYESAVEDLRLSLSDKRRNGSQPLADLCGELLRRAKVVAELGESLLPALADATPYREVTDPYVAVLRRRARLLGEVLRLSDPAALPEQKEIAGLQRLGREMAELRPAAEKLAEAVLNRQAEDEALLEQLLTHYSTERLAVIDKLILFISLYELRENKLEIAIVISEATALANEYSGPKSAPFIHGLIAAAARS